MIKGIGIDTVYVKTIRNYILQYGKTFIERTFTPEEVAVSHKCHNQAEYLSTRFAVKEAVFKAVAHGTKEGGFDLRIVETLNYEDGCPYININEKLAGFLKEAKVDRLHVSITTENDYVSAFVVAEAIN